MIATLASVPIDRRYDAGLALVQSGADPFEVLHAVIWPEDASALFRDEPELVTGACRRGHPWTNENTRRARAGYRICRTCAKASAASRSSRRKRNRRKLPCVFCGSPCTAPNDKGSKGGSSIARCWTCFLKQRREKS